MTRPEWAPEDIDISVPNAARMYDYSLGGFHNFAVDREMVERVVSMSPNARQIGLANRAFLGRAVRRLVASGVRQFLDVGSGIPTLASVHEVAQQADPEARVMYVDIDPVAVAHGRAILAGNPNADVMLGDVRRPDDIVRDPAVSGLLDFTEPIAVMLIAVLHFVPDSDDPAGIVRRFREAVKPGSYIALSHGSPPPQHEEDAAKVSTVYQRTSTPLHLRSSAEIGRLLDGLEIVEPGVVPVTAWHPDDTGVEPRPEVLAAVGRKP
ncbi:SAM-dependent methyltransferase [Dactylosporangium sp. NPDC000244]|uniref:SAM-dependent methyltransferase n=1 Tax=Dactylosporangium sp. NPDC000244 TaxID=3154365 RepID=UPI0033309A0B|nr:SAM-dependent methyltransferase [Dactylosporangium thailandense]